MGIVNIKMKEAATVAANTIANNDFADQLLNNLFDNTNLANEMLDKFKLNWSVSKTPLLLPTGQETGFYGIVRDDTMQTFSTCKANYTPYQNAELAELMVRLSEKTGYTLHSGGMFNDGGKVFLQLDTHSFIKEIGENKSSVKGYATGINSHDGTTSLSWGAVNFTICCRNTFAAARSEMKTKFRHSKNIHTLIDQELVKLGLVVEQEKSLFDRFIKMAEVPAKRDFIKKVVMQITEVDLELQAKEAKEKYTPQTLKKAEELTASIGEEMRSKGQTLWGLFSGVTHYTSHKLSAPKRENGRLESKYTGTGLDIDNKALQLVSSFM